LQKKKSIGTKFSKTQLLVCHFHGSKTQVHKKFFSTRSQYGGGCVRIASSLN